MRLLSLSQRLMAAERYVRAGAIAADVGCDHAKLAVYLAFAKCPAVYACDVNPLPLQRARQTVSAFHAEDKVTLLLSDGLANVPRNVTDVIVTGMGGELISKLIFREKWLYSPSVRLILQPQSFASRLRKELYQQGFFILDETPIIEPRHTYCVICAQYRGVRQTISDRRAVIGTLDAHSDPASTIYLQRQYIKYKKMAQGMHQANVRPEHMQNVLNILHALKPWKE